MTEPTDDELAKPFTEETGFDVDDFPQQSLTSPAPPGSAGASHPGRVRLQSTIATQSPALAKGGRTTKMTGSGKPRVAKPGGLTMADLAKTTCTFATPAAIRCASKEASMLNNWEKRNRMVRVTNEPTGVTAVASEYRSQHRNRDAAYAQLRSKVAVGSVFPLPLRANYVFPDGEPCPKDINKHRRGGL